MPFSDDHRTITAFQHTHLGVYVVATFTAVCLLSDSLQGFVDRYHLNKKWYFLYGSLCCFAYLYVRPFIRVGIGSASKGYVNFWAVYIGWLCSAVLFHLPSFAVLGIDIKADVSLLISVFLGSLLVMVVLHGLQWAVGGAAYTLAPGIQKKEIASILLLNSMSLAMACSSYFSFCGNGAASASPPTSTGRSLLLNSTAQTPSTVVSAPAASGGYDWGGGYVRAAVCSKWLHPILTTQYPTFSAYMIYGEGSLGNMYLTIDFPLDGRGSLLVPAASVISPVFTMWITLLALYLVNVLVDALAARDMEAGHISEVRRQVSEPDLAALANLLGESSGPVLRRASRSLELVRPSLRKGKRHRRGGSMAGHWVVEATMEAVARQTHFLRDRAAAFIEQHPYTVEILNHIAPELMPKETSTAQPSFLPMVPWYSGTSADLFKTGFDLMVSLKLFLGRFDMRTMQAATAASMADSFNDTPAEGDGFTYEHLASRKELWFDFLADTGDGGHPTYTVARAAAAPVLQVEVAEGVEAGARPGGSTLALPRGDLLLLGGDLAYPNPSQYTYENRLFAPFQDAFPPPPHYHPGRLVVHKPDLPPAYGVQESSAHRELRGLSPRASRSSSAAALQRYEGPNCFAIPGNHDWVDGLDTFIRHIQHKGWLGGWLLPQEKSYFALALPHGWWVFGLDLALVGDMDMCQYRYFANVVEQRLAPDDQVMILTHEPVWLLDWFWERAAASNLRQLVRGHLRGRCRLHLAGDLHFYMRHSFTTTPPPPPTLSEISTGMKPAQPPTHAASPPAPHPTATAAPTPANAPTHSKHQSKRARHHAPPTTIPATTPAAAHSASRQRQPPASKSPTLRPPTPGPPAAVPPAHRGNKRSNHSRHHPAWGPARGLKGASGTETDVSNDTWESSSLSSGSEAETPAEHHAPGAHRNTASTSAHPNGTATTTATTSSAAASPGPPVPRLPLPLDPNPCPSCAAAPNQSGHHMHDPEHLIVNGLGGAFLHPTHVFSYARFTTVPDEAAEATAAIYSTVQDPCSCGPAGLGPAPFSAAAPWTYSAPLQAPPTAPPHRARPAPASGAARATPSAPTGADGGGSAGGSGSLRATYLGPDGEYVCEAAYPPPRTTIALGKKNLHVFRIKNSRFDIVGGGLYFLIVASVLPRCSSVSTMLDAGSFTAAAAAFAAAFTDALAAIAADSYLSLATTLLLFLICFGFTCSGGVGAVNSSKPRTAGISPGVGPSASRLREANTAGSGAGGEGVAAAAAAGAPGAGPSEVNTGLQCLARTGGLGMQALFAVVHTGAHVTVAVVLMLLLEVGALICIRYEGVGREGMHSLYHWWRSFEKTHFPDPMGLRDGLETLTGGLYPGILKAAFAVWDIPTAIAASRIQMCATGGGLASLTRLQAVAYYMGMLAYYWVLATPAMGLVFGLYLYVSVCFFHVHYDEAFAALRIPDFKGFTRMHISRNGDLEIFSLATDRVPTAWQEDPRWAGPQGGGGGKVAAHKAKYPSRWVPAAGGWGARYGGDADVSMEVGGKGGRQGAFKVVDYLRVPKERPAAQSATRKGGHG